MNVDEFRKLAGNVKIIDKVAEREQYSHDIGDLPAIMTKTLFKTLPDFVVQPKNVDEIKQVLAFANDHKIPVVPRGSSFVGIRRCHPYQRWNRYRFVPFPQYYGD